VNPAHCVFNVVEVHGRGLLGAGGGDVGHRGSTQVGGQDVLGVGDEQHGRTVHRLWQGKEKRRVVMALQVVAAMPYQPGPCAPVKVRP